MPEIESSKLILLSKDRVFSKTIREAGEIVENNLWVMSSPVPGTIIKTWEIYHGVQLVLSRIPLDPLEEYAAHYQIFQSLDLVHYSLVHDHYYEIYDIFWIDDGNMVLCAEDGWFETVNAGLTWTLLSLAPLAANVLTTIRHTDGSIKWVIYGIDQKVYISDYPDGSWVEVLDTTDINTGRWYSAMAGSSVCILAGAGPYLFRAISDDPTAWTMIDTLDGVIKSIRISDQSANPTFFVVVEREDGDHLYSSADLGDSLTEMLGSRIDPQTSIESIVPTLGNTTRTTFAVVGRRSNDIGVPVSYKLIEM